ncbi:hypothetical protein Tco_1338211 [Tanacetum coccineum]
MARHLKMINTFSQHKSNNASTIEDYARRPLDEAMELIDEEDPIPHDLADSDDEDLVNIDIDDGVNVVYSSEEEH